MEDNDYDWELEEDYEPDDCIECGGRGYVRGGKVCPECKGTGDSK